MSEAAIRGKGITACHQIKARVRRLAHERAADMIDRIRKEEEEKRQVLESFYLVNFHVSRF